MSGTNKVVKPGQVLFRAGDKSDGMYLIRKGELRVYLEQGGKEVALATVGSGGMIGEMALFDGAPRSASVKAVTESEVTLISTDDFGKLMKQIPKWFVGLMSSLSTRLRQTNERLQKLETGMTSKTLPFQTPVRILNVIILLWAKDGVKDGKDFVVQKAAIEKTLIEVFNEDTQKLRVLFDILVKEKVLSTRQDSYKNVVFSLPNRAVLSQLAAFIPTWVKANPKLPCLDGDGINILRSLDAIVQASPYDSTTVSLSELQKEGKKKSFDTAKWDKAIMQFQAGGDELRLVKASGGHGLRTSKKESPTALKHHEVLAAFFKANMM